jgi:hypothetical protein
MKNGHLLRYAVVLCVVTALGGAIALAGNTNGGPEPNQMMARAMGPVTIGVGWQGFNWAVVPPTDSTDNPMTFTLTQPGYLSVVDCYFDGDQFEIRDGATLIATTSVPLNDGQFVLTPDLAWLNHTAFSWASIPLAAGSHSINVRVIQGATGFTSGKAFLRVDYDHYGEPIPTLGWLGLLGLAVVLAAVGFVFLRRS